MMPLSESRGFRLEPVRGISCVSLPLRRRGFGFLSFRDVAWLFDSTVEESGESPEIRRSD